MKTKKLKTIIVPLIFALILLLGAGCASTKVTSSGFLDDYSKLKPSPEDKNVIEYVKPGVDWKSYDAALIEHVVIWYSSDADYKGIHPRELLQFAEYFEQALVKNLESKYTIVDKPGPGVLLMRIAITDVDPSNPTMDTITAVVPQARAISGIRKMTTGAHAYVGQASMEAVMLDSQTNERLAAIVQRRVGAKKVLYDKDKWADARDAFDQWAKTLRSRLDRGY